MATRNQKNAGSTKPEEKSKNGSPWNTPTGIAAIVGAIATLITALTGLFTVLPKISLLPATPTLKVITITANPCDKYFEGNIVEVEAGVPANIDLSLQKTTTIKFMDNTNLIGSLKLISEINTVFTANEKCEQTQPPITIKPSVSIEAYFDDFTATYIFDQSTNTLNVTLKKK